MDFLRFIYKKASILNFAHLLVLGLVIKSIVHDVSVAAFLLTIPVLAFESYKLYLKHKTPEPVQIDAAIIKRLDANKEELDAIKSKLTAQTLEKNVTRQAFKW